MNYRVIGNVIGGIGILWLVYAVICCLSFGGSWGQFDSLVLCFVIGFYFEDIKKLIKGEYGK